MARSVVAIGRLGSERKFATPRASCRSRRRGRAGLRRPAANGSSSPNGSAAPAPLPDRPGCRRRSGHRAPRRLRAAPRAAGCRQRSRVGRIEEQDAGEARAPARRQLPVLALDVVDDCRPRPGEQRRDDQTDALAGPRRRETEHVLRSIMAQIVTAEASEHNAVRLEEACLADLWRGRPARRAIGGRFLGLARPPHRHADCDRDRREAA